MGEFDVKYLSALSVQYPTVASATTEIVNLRAIMALPKSTEHFITDLHGEYEQFNHIMANGSGAVRRKIDDCFGRELCSADKRQLASLIYCPELKLRQIRETITNKDELADWYTVVILRLIRVCQCASSKYTRSKVRKALPKDFSYIIDELLMGRQDVSNQAGYYQEIIRSVLKVKRAPELITDLCLLIRRFTIDHLHVIGDIFDRGPYPHLIMDDLMKHHQVDIEWGNHDILWMGAAMGNAACVANVLRISARYGNLPILEDAYGINMIPLMRFAMNTYKENPGKTFAVQSADEDYDNSYADVDSRMQKAAAMIQFKLEGQLIKAHPEWNMEDRMLLHTIDLNRGIFSVAGVDYPLNDTYFPTLNAEDPYRLTEEEEEVIRKMQAAFMNSERLQRHVRFLFTKGSMYKVYNDNLLFHGCIPTESDGSFMQVMINGKKVSGKALYVELEQIARKGFSSQEPEERRKGGDYLWFCWECPYSPLFGKNRMATFERYFTDDKSAWVEEKNPYYNLYEDNDYIDRVLREFDVPLTGHVINGHMPVAAKKGESPAKCGGRVLVIDGGFSRAYQKKTGIAGYTLTYNSYGLILAAHQPFSSMEEAVLSETDTISQIVMEEEVRVRKTVGDTDIGKGIKERIVDLEALTEAYLEGILVEKA